MSTVSKIPSFSMGGWTITDVDSLVVLSSYISIVNAFNGFNDANNQNSVSAIGGDINLSKYQVPAGYNLRIISIRQTGGNYSHGMSWAIGYWSGVLNHTASPPFDGTEVYSFGGDLFTPANTSTSMSNGPMASSTLKKDSERPTNFVVPEGMWPFARSSGASVSDYLIATGILEAI